MSAEDTEELREELGLEEERPSTTEAAEEFAEELRRRGILED